ncbi:MAG: hypothetical protein IKX25_02840 [Bacteroidales bacterium]|nr:hypothetical protein [Bacteroidales bacterium]
MRKFPKYIVMPVALAIFFIAVLLLSIKQNHGHLPDDFALIATIEAIILIALFFVLRHLHMKRKG